MQAWFRGGSGRWALLCIRRTTTATTWSDASIVACIEGIKRWSRIRGAGGVFLPPNTVHVGTASRRSGIRAKGMFHQGFVGHRQNRFRGSWEGRRRAAGLSWRRRDQSKLRLESAQQWRPLTTVADEREAEMAS
jgi:hypothetical protein